MNIKTRFVFFFYTICIFSCLNIETITVRLLELKIKSQIYAESSTLDFPWLASFATKRPAVKLCDLFSAGGLILDSTSCLYFPRIFRITLLLQPTLDNAVYKASTEAFRLSFWRQVWRVSYTTSVLLNGWFDSWVEMMLSTLSSKPDISV